MSITQGGLGQLQGVPLLPGGLRGGGGLTPPGGSPTLLPCQSLQDVGVVATAVVVGSASCAPAWVWPSLARRPAHYLHRGLKLRPGPA